ncbi:MAG TPA: thiamine pyrophosphate-dependent enzyme [Edaphobacter sp.]
MTVKGAGEAGENPLVPNTKLRQMYTLMLEARTLDEAVKKRARLKGVKRVATIYGQEAVRVSTTIDLGEEDLVSDVSVTAGMGLILGGAASSLLRGLSRPKADADKVLAEAGVNRILKATETPEERVRMALGAALALKTRGRQGVVVAYAAKGELAPAAWRKLLEPAGRLSLPIIFVVLPAAGARKADADIAEICDASKAVGIPGIPVDAFDSVALYRVTQESLGRTRSGDGPVLIESVRWTGKGASSDPLEYLKDFLLERRICDKDWFSRKNKIAAQKK